MESLIGLNLAKLCFIQLYNCNFELHDNVNTVLHCTVIFLNKKLALGSHIMLLFSLFQFVGIYLAFKYRHLKDPRANPSAFL